MEVFKTATTISFFVPLSAGRKEKQKSVLLIFDWPRKSIMNSFRKKFKPLLCVRGGRKINVQIIMIRKV